MKQKIYLILPALMACALFLLFFNKPYTQETFLRFSEAEDFSQTESPSVYNPYTDLSVPTYFTKIGDTYFLVDCYHNQILYSSSSSLPLSQWQVMTDKIHAGHTIAGDGTVYMADDTEQNRILIYEKKDGRFIHTQTFRDIGIRPHYIQFDEKTRLFYALSSMTGELYVFGRSNHSTQMYLKEIRSIPQLDGVYVRSFTIIGNDIYFVSGNCSIIRARLSDLKILEEYPVPASIAGMVQLINIQNYFYITVSTDASYNQDFATLIRTRDLRSLADGDYEDIYHHFIGGGTPYYMTAFDGHYYLTEHRIPGHSIWQFDVEEDKLVNITTIY